MNNTTKRTSEHAKSFEYTFSMADNGQQRKTNMSEKSAMNSQNSLQREKTTSEISCEATFSYANCILTILKHEKYCF